MKAESYQDKCVKEIFKELEEHRPKAKWTAKSLAITLLRFLFNFGSYIVIFIYVIICALQGAYLINSESSAGDWIGMAALFLSFLAVVEKNINFDSGIKYIYYYEFVMIDSINEIISQLYHNKKYSNKIKMDSVECVEIKRKNYLKITYH